MSGQHDKAAIPLAAPIAAHTPLPELIILHDEAAQAVVAAETTLRNARAWEDYLARLVTISERPVRSKIGVSSEVSARQDFILRELPISEASARNPADIYAKFVAETGDRETTIETFRTTVWRMKSRNPFQFEGKQYCVMHSDAGYWKEPAISLATGAK